MLDKAIAVADKVDEVVISVVANVIVTIAVAIYYTAIAIIPFIFLLPGGFIAFCAIRGGAWGWVAVGIVTITTGLRFALYNIDWFRKEYRRLHQPAEA